MDKELKSEFIVTTFCDYVESYLKYRKEEELNSTFPVLIPSDEDSFDETYEFIKEIREELATKNLKIEIADPKESVREFGHQYAFLISKADET